MKTRVIAYPTEDNNALIGIMKCIKSYDYSDYGNIDKCTKGKYIIGIPQYANKKYFKTQYVYIISDEDIKEGDWCFSFQGNRPLEQSKEYVAALKNSPILKPHYKKIIATNDPSTPLASDFTKENLEFAVYVLNSNNFMRDKDAIIIDKHLFGFKDETYINDLEEVNKQMQNGR